MKHKIMLNEKEYFISNNIICAEDLLKLLAKKGKERKKLYLVEWYHTKKNQDKSKPIKDRPITPLERKSVVDVEDGMEFFIYHSEEKQFYHSSKEQE